MDCQYHGNVFLKSPVRLVEVWVQVIVSALTTLFSVAEDLGLGDEIQLCGDFAPLFLVGVIAI
jgi:hypothetical protein